MGTKERRVMKKRKSMNSKGFSLVEFISVIAVTAILVAVMAPQLMKYVERARVSKDTQTVGTVYTAVVTAMLNPAADDAPAFKTYDSLAELYGDTANSSGFAAAVKEIMNEINSDDFIQISRKNSVNIKHIKQYKKGAILLDNNQILKIGIAFKSAVAERLIK